MQTRGSRFVRFQEMKLQERAIEVRGLTCMQGQTTSPVLVHADPLQKYFNAWRLPHTGNAEPHLLCPER